MSEVIISLPVLEGQTLSENVVHSIISQKEVDIELWITVCAPNWQPPKWITEEKYNNLIINAIDNTSEIACHNHVVGQAKGEYIVLLSPQTWLFPDSILRITDDLKSNPEAGVAFSSSYKKQTAQQLFSNVSFRHQWNQYQKKHNRFLQLKEIFRIQESEISMIVIQHEVLGEIKELNESLRDLAKFEFFLKVSSFRAIWKSPSLLAVSEIPEITETVLKRFRRSIWQTWVTFKFVFFGDAKLQRDSLKNFRKVLVHRIKNAIGYTWLTDHLKRRYWLYKKNIKNWKKPRYFREKLEKNNRYQRIINLFSGWPLPPRKRIRGRTSTDPKIGYVIWMFPALSETFIRRQVEGLDQIGINISVFADIFDNHPQIDPISLAWKEKTNYLSPKDKNLLKEFFVNFMLRKPLRMIWLFFYVVFHRYSYDKNLLDDIKVFSDIIYLAGALQDQGIQHVHAGWGDRKAFVSLIAARLLDVTFSVEYRAFDLHRWSSKYGQSEIITHADLIITNTEYNLSYIKSYLREDQYKKVHISRTRLDPDRFCRESRPEPHAGPVRLLSVGRLIEQKGFIHLLHACRRLKNQGISFHCQIIGGANLENDIRTYITLQSAYRKLELADVITFRGAQSLSEVMKALNWADVFVLPCVIEESGARDIDPNVIVEAMSMELPVVSTPIGGVPEIIDNKINGYIVESENDEALFQALLKLINDPERRIKFGEAGRNKILRDFDLNKNSTQLAEIYKSIERS